MRTIALALLLALPTLADELTVQAAGETRVRPDRLELLVGVDASHEKAGEAVKELKEKLAKVRAALEKAAAENKLQGLTLSESGVIFAPPPTGENEIMIAIGGGGEKPAAEMHARQELSLSAGNVDALPPEELSSVVAALVDAAREAGGSVDGGGNSFLQMPSAGGVAFRVTDLAKAEEEALEQALAEARKKAEAIAKKFGREIGEVVNVTELAKSPDEEAMAIAGADPDRLTASGEAVIERRVRVTWRLK